MNKPPGALVSLLRRHDPAVRSLALELRAIVVDELAPVHEYIFPMRARLALLYSTTPRVIADGICQIGVFTRHVTLMFVAGVDLPDPSGVLRGSGRTMRHMPIKTASDLARPEVRALLRAARQNAGAAAARSGSAAVVTRVKPSSQPKRKYPARSRNAGLRALGFNR
jgi:hypothetical protein